MSNYQKVRVGEGWRYRLIWAKLLLILSGVLLVVGCQQDILTNPRIATSEALSRSTSTPSPTPLLFTAPTPTANPLSEQVDRQSDATEKNQTLSVWINETSPEHRLLMNQLTETFTNKTGIQLEVQLVSPDLMPELVETAVISNTLPDLLLHPLELSIGWAEEGILDVEMATELMEHLGRDTFDEGGIQKLSVDESAGQVAAIPSHGWKQLLIFRSDWFQELGLPQPDTYDRLLVAAESIHNPEESISGLVVPTEADLATTQQVFEHFALANGCELVEESGKVALLHPACLDALEYYRQLVNEFSPIGFQTDTSALTAYLSGRTGIIVTSPVALPFIAGLEEGIVPTCNECLDRHYLIDNSGIVTNITGNGQFATSADFASLTALGVTKSADPELAESFVDFWFGDAYLDWISINPERKYPLRSGTSSQPNIYADTWVEIPLRPGSANLATLLGTDLANLVGRDVADADRWAFKKEQGSLMTVLYENLVLAPLLQEMLSGYFTSSQTIVEMYTAVANSIAGYVFPLEVVPTPTP